jgi:DDE family transposase
VFKLLTKNGGLSLFNDYWTQLNISENIDKAIPKKSGSATSSIFKNLIYGHIIKKHSLEELSYESKSDYFFTMNTTIHRTNYSRNMNRVGENIQNLLLKKVVNNIKKNLKFSKKSKKNALQIIDGSALEITGKTYEQADWVYDSRKNGLVWGYEIISQIIRIGEYSFPFSFTINNSKKDKIIEIFEEGRSDFGINKVSFDAGFRGMDFFFKLNKKKFKFYTKATLNWIWDNNFFYQSTSKIKKNVQTKFWRNYRFIDLKVNKEVDEGDYKGEKLKLRLVFVKGDKRVFLSNDFESSNKEIYDFYLLRWKIEESFKEEKLNLGFEKLPVRKINGIQTHLMAVFIAFILCQLVLSKFKNIAGIKLLVRYVIKKIGIIKVRFNKLHVEFLEKFEFQNQI